MSYQWGSHGPAFEVQGIYRAENRALVARAVLLAAFALAVLVLALTDISFPRWMPTRLLRLPQDGIGWHALMGVLMLLLAAFDMLRASRQRALRLLPGQPGALVTPVRTANTPNPDAAPLAELLEGGAALASPGAPSSWGSTLRRVSPLLATMPHGLQAWVARRLARLWMLLGLVVALGLALVLLRPASQALVGLLCIATAGIGLLRTAPAEREVAAPRSVAMRSGFVLVAGLAAGWALGFVPAKWTDWLAAGGWPLAAAATLATLLLVELLALGAGLVVVDPPLPRGPQPLPCSVEIDATADRVQQELERELHRYWSEGVPNRRYLWQSNQGEHTDTGAGFFAASSLEETQPLMLSPASSGPGAGRRSWLLLLLTLALLLTVAGGLLWGWVVYDQLQRAAQPWRMASASAMLLLCGAYAVRVGHLLWSRVEVQSRLLSLQCSAVSPAAAPVQLRWTVAQARSVFYAAADHEPGSRTLLELTSDEAAARASAEQVQHYAEKRSPADDPDAPEAATPPGPLRAPRPPTVAPTHRPAPAQAPVHVHPHAPGVAPTPGVRYCTDCGEAMPATARFCPRCGERQRGV